MCYLFLHMQDYGKLERSELTSWCCVQYKHPFNIPDVIVFYSSTTLKHNKACFCFVVFLCRIHSHSWHHGARSFCSAGRPSGGLNTLPYLFFFSPLHFKHPIYSFHEVDLVDWVIFTVGRLTVGLRWNELPNQFQMGTVSKHHPCIAGIGFVIENEMKCLVSFFPLSLFIADYSFVLFACYDFHWRDLG